MPKMFRRQHHNDILKILQNLNGDLLEEAECFFGGGTAIVLDLDEYRESVDIDFLCSSKSGYRMLRQAVFGPQGLLGILRPNAEVEVIRDVQTDQYGIRAFVGTGDTKVKFEIVRESRIDLAGSMDDRYGVPVLDRNCMYAEKLLANADRWLDKAVLNRDLLDLLIMQSRWHPIPETAWQVAEEAYGETARKAYDSAMQRLRDQDWLQKCMEWMAIDLNLKDEILAQL
jgi:hypothetical protein